MFIEIISCVMKSDRRHDAPAELRAIGGEADE